MTPGLFVQEHHSSALGVPAVLVHGAPDRSRNFAGVLAHLEDIRVLTYDRRGYGKSIDVAPPALSFVDHAHDLIGIVRTHFGETPVVGAAQSVGCNALMTAATLAPEMFRSVAVWEPPNAWCDWWPDPALHRSASAFAAAEDTEAMAEEFNRGILGDERWDSLQPHTRAMLRAEGAAFKRDMAAELVAPYHFADYRTPTVVGCGTNTSSGHLDGARILARLLGAELYEVEGANHFAPMSSPAAWAEMVRRAIALAERA